MPGVPGTRKQILLNALVSVPTTLFQQTLSDSFTRADSSFGGAGSSSGGGNGWIDVNGGVAKIVSNKLSLTGDSVNTSQYLRDFVVRPTNEAFKDGRLEFDTLASTWNPSGNVSAHLRHQSGSNNNYLAKIKCDGTDLQIYSVVAGTPSLVAGGGSISGFSNSKAYRIRFECYGTQLLLTVFDVSGGTPVSVGAIQGVSSAISLAGVAGVGPQWGVLGASHSIHNLNISARKNISIGIISDSILANTPTGAPYSTGEALVRSIADRVGKTYTISNQGVAGRTSTDWLPGPNLNAAKAALPRPRF